MNSKTGIWPWSHESSRATDGTQITPKKRFMQLKDSHIAVAGMIWEVSDQNYNFYRPLTLQFMKISEPSQWSEPKRAIEDNPDWFEELVPLYVNKEMMDKIGTLALKSAN